MKKKARNLQVILSAAAALFIALSPLIHGLHLAFASHTHNHCSVCIDSISTHSHGKFRDCHDYAVGILSASAEDHSTGHNPDTCPLCRQFTQLLKNQVILQSYIPVVLNDSIPEERIEVPWHFFNTDFNNVIPRAPPAC